MAGVTLPPAGSGRTFPGGCFFRSQGEGRQGEKGKGAIGDLALLSGRAFLAPMRPLAWARIPRTGSLMMGLGRDAWV